MDALDLGAREHVATVGGGGKTTLGIRLAQALVRKGRRVVLTTTTKVWSEEAEGYARLLLCPAGSDVRRETGNALEGTRLVFIAGEVLDTGKLDGISPEQADLIFNAPTPEYVIVEADGAAGRPVKAPYGNEPVIPGSATVVIAVMGLESIGAPLDSNTVFRLSRFERLTGLKQGQPLDPAALVHLFQGPQGLFRGTPASAKRIVFMNKTDLCKNMAAAEHLAGLLINDAAGVDRVIMGSLYSDTYALIH